MHYTWAIETLFHSLEIKKTHLDPCLKSQSAVASSHFLKFKHEFGPQKTAEIWLWHHDTEGGECIYFVWNYQELQNFPQAPSAQLWEQYIKQGEKGVAMRGDCREERKLRSRFTTSSVWLGLLTRRLQLSRKPRGRYVWPLSLSPLLLKTKLNVKKYVVWGGQTRPVLHQSHNALKMCWSSIS